MMLLWRKWTRLSERPLERRLILAPGVLDAINNALSAARTRHHEGVAYLLGVTNGSVTAAMAVANVEARTTAGSFDVDSVAMARVVRTATDRGMQMVGQVHTHPTLAFHSDGDEAGARIRYPGYVSVVLPNYGGRLPLLDGSACFMFDRDYGFVALPESAVIALDRSLL